MKSTLKNIASNPYIQSAFVGAMVTLLVYFVWDTSITKYKVEVEPFAHKSEAKMHWFVGDFNNDGNSERIRCFNGINSQSMDIVYYNKDGNLIEHFHFHHSDWTYTMVPKILDIDEDGSQEILFFTTRNDSIFLNAFNLKKFSPVIDQLYFNSFERKRNNYAQTNFFGEYGDFDNDGKNELFFSFDAGFGLNPRGLFKLQFPSLEISASSTDYMVINSSSFTDFNSDGIPEILCNVSSPCNVDDNNNKYSDTLAYITVLDYDLTPIFAPIPMGPEYSSIVCLPSPKHNSLFYSLYYCRSNHEEPFKIMVVNNHGEIVNEKSWMNIANPEDRYRGFEIVNGNPYVFFHDVGRFELTPSLEKLPGNLNYNQNSPNQTPNCLIDLNDDGWDEWIYYNQKDILKIYNEKVGELLTLNSPLSIEGFFKVIPYYEDKKITKYFVDTGGGYFFFKYQKNHLFFSLYLIYFFVFLITASLIFVILYFQKRTIEKKWNTEKQLSELQFNAVKNQLNPHFLFNALNSVAFMINEGKNDEAYDFLALNSRMIQRVMNDAKEVKRPLKDEIQFTKDYLKIQKHRFKDRFDTEFIVEANVDENIEVPKMCIHTYAENAIKHGFRNTKSGGLLKISIEPEVQGILIAISDNGMGRIAASKYKDSTGNGINIMKEFYRLFDKYHGFKIDFLIEDNKPTGTVVKLKLIIHH
ncbi:histidine kinase [uncultured Draconibacterium sp.]|uniref:histidine kinase n=1 Tax=uncultured Draconibacterium sp. TaxID=1573823 RepID=UPI0025FCC19F|nr:histidine kinase [uncultured Draconibacterium sp.]